MQFEVIGKVTSVETISVGRSIHELPRLIKAYGKGRWRKLKGVATVRLSDGSLHKAEVHWYAAHGIGNKELKIKYFIDPQ